MKIAKMTEVDVPQVAKIEKDCFSQPWSIDAFYEELQNPYGLTLVAKSGDEVIGFINVRVLSGEVYINNIAVKESCRRRGVAQALLSELDLQLEDCDFFTLEVRKSNFSAIALYEKCGYIKVGARKNFYEKPTEDAIIMTKHFSKGERI